MPEGTVKYDDLQSIAEKITLQVASESDSDEAMKPKASKTCSVSEEIESRIYKEWERTR